MKTDRLKLHLKKENSVNIVLSLFIVGLTFAMLYLAPLRLDDWTWGSSIGIDRLKTFSAGYNGRFFSNTLTPILLHIPTIFRVVFEVAVLGGVGYCLYRCVKNAYLFYFSLILILLIPAEMYNETVTWVSGFTNFIVPIFSVLFIYNLCINHILENKQLSVVSICLICPVVILSQGILETTTIYIFFILVVTLCLYYVRYKKLSIPCAIFLICSVIGALLMFSNEGYIKNINGQDYKEIHITGGLPFILSYAWSMYLENIITRWMAYGFMSVIVSFTMIPFSLVMSKRFSRINALISTGFFAMYMYCLVEKAWLDERRMGRTVFAILSIVFCLFILYLIINSKLSTKDKQNGFICAFSQIVLIAPLVFVYPTLERCFLQPYIHWILLVCFMLKHITGSEGIKAFVEKAKRKITIYDVGMITRLLVCAFLILSIAGQSIAYKAYKLRDEAIAKGLESGSSEIVVPEVPNYTKYCIGANVLSFDDYWMENYQRFYGIPYDVKVTFVDYYDYLEEYT